MGFSGELAGEAHAANWVESRHIHTASHHQFEGGQELDEVWGEHAAAVARRGAAILVLGRLSADTVLPRSSFA